VTKIGNISPLPDYH